MSRSPSDANDGLTSLLHRLAERLREGTAADRTTLRLDAPTLSVTVNTAIAESVGPGVPSIKEDASLDQRRLETVVWLEQHRTTLVQEDFSQPPVAPRALIEVYGVEAQVLEPVVFGDNMVGWLSVHSLRARPWSQGDLAVVHQIRAEVERHVHGVLA